MYTQCPKCTTLFGVSAEQLRTARGNVRCGQCLTVFDALENLRDGSFGPATADPADPPQLDPVQALSLPDDLRATREQSLEYQAPAEVAETATETDAGEHAVDPQPLGLPDNEPSLGEIGPPAEVASPLPVVAAEDDESDASERQAPPELLDSAASASLLTPLTHIPVGKMPEVLREDLSRAAAIARAGRWRIVFVAASFMLLGFLVVQVAAFQPREVLIRYPQAEPALKKLCALTGCRLPRRHNPSAIRVVSRDVRIHPDYESALSITATLMNTAPYRQAYARLQFTLFNVNGQVIASRIFKPREYLNRAVAPTERMHPRRPLQIALELMAPEQVAVSFEFRFL